MPYNTGDPLYRMYIVRDGMKWYYCNTIGYRNRVHRFKNNTYSVLHSSFREVIEGESRWMRLHGFKDTLHIESFTTLPVPVHTASYLDIPVAIEDVSRSEVERFYRAEGLLR